MEPKDLALEDYHLEPRVKHTSLHLEPSNLVCKLDDDINQDSNNSSPISATTQSPLTPLFRSNPVTSELDAVKEPASGPQRAKPSASSSKSEKEKRKRSRVTPEQLVHLERLFSTERSPTAARRREISERLGMQERQTQIWFQNRRAKAKLQDGKQKGCSGSAEAPPDTPPELSTGFEVDLHNLIHEDEPVTIIPCTDLSIGTWRRIATTVGKHDLVAYVCESKRCLTWFIHSAGYGFKMEIPFEIILETEFSNAAPGSGLASFILSQPPIFYMENISTPCSDGTMIRDWKRCADWTEGHQATKVLRHDLIGSAVQLAHLLRNLQAGGSDIALHSPSYTSSAGSPPAPMELPQPPLAGLSTSGYHYGRDTPDVRTPERHDQGRQRSESVSSSLLASPFSSLDSDSHMVHVPSPAFSPHIHHESARPMQPSASFLRPNFPGYPISENQQSPFRHSQPSLDNYGSVGISHGIAPRPYAAQPVPRTFYHDETQFVSATFRGDLERHSQSLSSQPFATSSPPLLNTPYHPRIDNLGTGHPDLMTATAPIISGLPGVPYEADNETQHGQNH